MMNTAIDNGIVLNHDCTMKLLTIGITASVIHRDGYDAGLTHENYQKFLRATLTKLAEGKKLKEETQDLISRLMYASYCLGRTYQQGE